MNTYQMLEYGNFTAFTIAELFMDNHQEGKFIRPKFPPRSGLMIQNYLANKIAF